VANPSRSAEGDLIHIELQSTSELEIAIRMMEYCIRVYRLFRRFPRQILLYVMPICGWGRN
jgi:hypothetical protein